MADLPDIARAVRASGFDPDNIFVNIGDKWISAQ